MAINNKIRLSALDFIFTPEDKLKYAKCLSKYRHLAFYFRYVEPRLIAYFHVLPSLFKAGTEENAMFRQALNEFFENGDADALNIYIKYYKSFVDARIEDMPLALKTNMLSTLTSKVARSLDPTIDPKYKESEVKDEVKPIPKKKINVDELLAPYTPKHQD